MSDLSSYDTFTLQELEYLAENEMITIIPKTVVKSQLSLLSGNFGPFTPGVLARVPLWLAMRLREDNLCRIVPPDWLAADALVNQLANEKATAEFCELPFHYQQIATILLTGAAAEDIPERERVAGLLDDVERTRGAKMDRDIKNALRQAATEAIPTLYNLTHAGALEINLLRIGFFRALDHISEMSEEQSRRDDVAARAMASVAMDAAPGRGRLGRALLRRRRGAAGAAAAAAAEVAAGVSEAGGGGDAREGGDGDAQEDG